MPQPTLADLTFEIEAHLKATEHLAHETEGLASDIAAGSTSVNAAATAGTFQWAGRHRHRMESLHMARIAVTDLVQRTTRVASLCMTCVIELVRVYSDNGTPAALEQLARATDIAERLVQLCTQQMTLHCSLIGALRAAQADGGSNEEAPVSDSAQQEAKALVERLQRKR